MKRLFLIRFAVAAAISALGLPARADAPKAAPAPAVYQQANAPLDARVDDLLAKLTLPEKISLLAFDSNDDGLKLDTPPVTRLGLPALRTTDAPEGIRDGPSSVFPQEIVMASTWDPGLVRDIGAAIGDEARQKNRQVVYGPSVNIDRTPQSGRYFENFGEDPFLTAQMSAAYIQGMQQEGVAACVKHYVCNDQEQGRSGLNVHLDERTFREVYLPPFEAAVQQGRVWALMTGLNQINGVPMSVNKPLLDLLRADWGWDGVVIPDWGSIYDTAASASAGANIEMPKAAQYAPGAVTDALNKGKITPATLDALVRPILRTMVRTGLLDTPRPASPPDPATVNTPAHRALALKAAQEGVTLLKNENNILPLDRASVKSIAVIGPNAAETPLGGRWSADVPPFYQVSVLDGIKKAAGGGVTVAFAQGCPRTGAGAAGGLAAAVALAAKSDAAVIVVGTDNNYEGENLDPPDLHLPGDQEKLIATVAAVNKKTIVILNGGTPFLVDAWLPSVPGLIDAWYAGQETGTAVAGVLFGDIDPSGRLPGTIAHRREEYSDWGTYPGANAAVTYSEGVYVGYRHFDQKAIAPLFPFGFGLSYTTFGYSGLKIPRHYRQGDVSTVSVTVRNTGSRAGDEIAQLYIEPVASKIDRPIRELKGFQRVSLKPGEKKTISFPIDAQSFAYWDMTTHAWQTDPGTYLIEVGASSRDLKLRAGMAVR